MSCRRAFDVDLVACLLDEGRPEWLEFREHYPRCPECAAEVRTWTELHARLAPLHPSPDDLARYESRANDMEPEARKAVAAHIATCRSCRDELRALRAFDPGTVAAPATVARAGTRRWWSPIRLVLHPAFAYGVAAALAFPLLAQRFRLAAPFGGARSTESTMQDSTPSSPDGRIKTLGMRDAPSPVGGKRDETTVYSGLAAEGGGQLRRPEARTAAAPTPAAPPPAAKSEEAEERTVVLHPSREVAFPLPARDVVLRLAPPRSQPAIPPGLGWLRLRDAAGRRELREQQFGAPGSPAEIRVPAGWFELGTYRLDLTLGDDNRPVTTARFRVEE